jgi:LmbE family N-acetylglucosaminyl deacetylase
MYYKFSGFVCCLLLSAFGFAQKPAKPSGADIHQAIKKLNVLGSALYVAAHPDDENQRFISYCANHRLFDVTYLSLTRGDGGQNLIGPEIRELLGVLRTQELLMARSIDGGKQRFSRANDFGFSKTPDETLRIWQKDAVLSDVVWAIRETQPDVVVNRFYHKKADTHGHHTSSAMLSVEAFDLAGRPDAYPEQLQYVQPWQPRRNFFNTSWWFYGGRDKFEKADKSNMTAVDLGVFLPLKGKSNNEVSAEARSMHRCQGFGAMSVRGESRDYFDLVKGDKPKGDDLFEGINTTWTRVAGGEKIGKLMAKIDRAFRPDNPAASVPDLLKASALIAALPDGHWKRVKSRDIKEVIRHCLGLYIEAVAEEPIVAPGEKVKLSVEATNRTPVPVVLTRMAIEPAFFDTTLSLPLAMNKPFTYDKVVRIPDNAAFSAPYWLLSPYTNGMYTVEEQRMRGKAETPRLVKVRWTVQVQGVPFEYESEVAWKVEESAIGEVWRPFEILPPVYLSFSESAYLFTGTQSKAVTVQVKAGRDSAEAAVQIQCPAGWTVAEGSQNVFFKRRGEEKTLVFHVTPGGTVSEGALSAVAHVGDRTYNYELITIKYDHIPQQSVLMPATVKASRIDMQVTAKNVGYLMGAGDDIPAALRQMGCNVTLLEDKDFTTDRLASFDAVVVGVRAYNTKNGLKFQHEKLLEYAQNGGMLLLQYNNNFELVLDKLSPFPMKLGRVRVTDENSPVRFNLPDHPILNTPNKLSARDFDGWVQERGLYFPTEWDAAFQAPISCNDPEEKPADGAILIAPYGKGYYAYTSLSFFRELPAGVPGAFRLFANLISLKQEGAR